MNDYFKRYRPLIDDWEAFVAAAQRPLPTTIWTNTLKISPVRLASFLAEAGIDLTPISWYPGGFRLPHSVMPGLRWEYLAGLYQVQEEIAMLPVQLMDLQPGDRVLDLCAAPGNKTVQMGVLMQNRGTVVANDRHSGRMKAARQALNRMGLMNVTTLTHDGANLPGAMGLFDKVLVDVPCSCEGTCRKSPGVLEQASLAASEKMTGVQKALLRKAVQLCGENGRIVYATCTFAPEENEMIVDAILREAGDALRLLPLSVTGLTSSPGVTEWQGVQFHPDLRHAIRIWPHQNDTGGFFVAVLEKVNSQQSAVNSHQTPLVGEQYQDLLQRQPWLEYATQRFGIDPTHFDPFAIVRWSKRGTYLVNADHRPPVKPRLDAIGMFFMRTGNRYPKLTTSVAMQFGHLATQNVIELTSEQAKAYLAREDVLLNKTQMETCTGTGYVLLRHQSFSLGVGLLRAQKQLVESMFPKAWSRPNVAIE